MTVKILQMLFPTLGMIFNVKNENRHSLCKLDFLVLSDVNYLKKKCLLFCIEILNLFSNFYCLRK